MWNRLRELRAGILGGVIAGMLLAGAATVDLQAQGPFSAQIQAALRVFLATPHTWTAAQTHTGVILFPNGTSTLPSIAFASEPGIGFYRSAVGFIGVGNDNGTTPTHTFGPTSFNMGSGGVVTWATAAAASSGLGDTGISRTAAGTLAFGNGTVGNTSGSILATAVDTTSGGFLSSGGQFKIGNGGATGIGVFTNNALTIGSTIKIDALPTVASGFGTSPSVTAGSTPFAGSVNVGTGGVATTGTINFNGTAFPSAPFCVVSNLLTNSGVRPNASTTALNFTTTTAWAASDIVTWHCVSSK